MKKKSIFSVMLSLFLIIGMVVQGYAASTQEKISDAKDKKQQSQTSLETTREKIAELEGKKDQSESYLQELNGQLSQLEASLSNLQTQYDEKQTELTKLQEELNEAKEKEASQYEDMKIRIRYMYENGTNNYLNMLFNANSIVDFLNQAENISKITEYDRDMLASYTETKELIQEKEQEVATEQEEIIRLQQESSEQQEAVEELVQATYDQIRDYQNELSLQQSEESALIAQIQEQEESINSLLKQAKEEEAARLLAEQKAREEEARKQAEAAAAKEKAEAEANKKPAPSKNPDKPSTGNETAKPSQPDTPIDTSKGEYLGRFKLTAYCTCPICCGKWSGGMTASGAPPTPGRTVAMAGVPFGTKLLINGNVYTVEDRGTAYGHVDILMGSHSEALSFGLKYADVYIVQ